MKIIIIVLFAFCASVNYGQNLIQSQPTQPLEPSQGWYKQACPIAGGLASVYFKDKLNGWASSGNFTIFTTNGGLAWLPYQPTGIGVLRFIDSFGYARTNKGNNWIATTTNGGKTWQNDSVYDKSFGGWYMLQFCTPSLGFIPQGADIATTHDGAKTWSFINSPLSPSQVFICFDSLNIFLGGGAADPNPPNRLTTGFAFSTNAGNSWSLLPAQLPYRLGATTAVKLDSHSLIIFVVGDSGTAAFRSINRGNSWKKLNLPSGLPPLGFGAIESACITEGHNITAVGELGVIIRSTDAGTTWIKQNSHTNVYVTDVSFADSLNGWATIDSQAILHTTDAGKTWVKQIPVYDSLNLQIYPNPATIQTTIGFTLGSVQHVSLSILDITGRVVLRPLSSDLKQQGTNFTTFSVANLPPGSYLYEITSEKYHSSGKFTVTH